MFTSKQLSNVQCNEQFMALLASWRWSARTQVLNLFGRAQQVGSSGQWSGVAPREGAAIRIAEM